MIVLILLTLVNGDIYSKAVQMPAETSHKACLDAGAQWLGTQKAEDSPQYLCLEKSDVSKMTGGDSPSADEPPKPKTPI